MNKVVGLAGLALVATSLSGCLSIDFFPHHSPPTPPAPAAPEYVPGAPVSANSVAIAEIDAAGNLTFENSKAEALKAIAGRASLPVGAQIHLIHRTFSRLDFEPSKVAVLQVLIKNPGFANAAKQTLLAQLAKFAFENNKTTLLAALNERGDLKD